jgi:hypothetical protein
MRRFAQFTASIMLVGLVSATATADSLMPSGPSDELATQKQNALIGKTFSLRGGNAFGSGLISVGYAPSTRSIVKAYFTSVSVNYGKSTIEPDIADDDPSQPARGQGEGFGVAYVNCHSRTYSYLRYPEVSSLNNVERSWFVRCEQNSWVADASLQKNPKWAVDVPMQSRTDLAQFFSDLCEATL